MTTINVKVKKPIEHSDKELSKELENINFNILFPKGNEVKQSDSSIATIPIKAIQDFRPDENPSLSNTKADKENIFIFYQKSMKWLFISGLCLGLNPVSGILETDPSKIRFSTYSLKFVYSGLLCFSQMFSMVLSMYTLSKSISVSILAFLSFYVSVFTTTFVFMRIAYKWSSLIRDIIESRLDEYIDPKVTFKCNLATVLALSLSIIEHILSQIFRYTLVLGCYVEGDDSYTEFTKKNFPWLKVLSLPRFVPIGVTLQILNVIYAMVWNYLDVFIVCISIFLTSILNLINKKISLGSTKSLPPSFWQSVREDYTRATKLVRCFDDVINGLIFTSFATNLFFVCLQLFNLLAHGIQVKNSQHCKSYVDGPFGGYEYAIYFSFSLALLFIRSLTVSLIAASVHTASLAPATALYDVPSNAYCTEVQRFLEQVHCDSVALSGLNFFYVTKGLVLSVAGTIVTYELVLLQFDETNIVQSSYG